MHLAIISAGIALALAVVVFIVLLNEKAVYIGGWGQYWHTLFGIDDIVDVGPFLWAVQSPCGYNPGTMVAQINHGAGQPPTFWVGDPGVWSAARIRGLRLLMADQGVTTISGFLLTHAHPDHIGNFPAFLKLADPEARIFIAPAAAWQLLWPSKTPNLPQRMNVILQKVGTRYLGWPLNAIYWTYPWYARIVFGAGATGVDERRFHFLRNSDTFAFAGGTLRAREFGGHTPSEMSFIVESDQEYSRKIVFTGDVIDNTPVERGLITPMPLPEGDFPGMMRVLDELMRLQPDVLVVEHGELIRGWHDVQDHLLKAQKMSRRIIEAVKQTWPSRKQYADYRAYAVAVFKQVGYRPTTALTVDEMVSIVASIEAELRHL